jgi:hypothetical protein
MGRSRSWIGDFNLAVNIALNLVKSWPKLDEINFIFFPDETAS